MLLKNQKVKSDRIWLLEESFNQYILTTVDNFIHLPPRPSDKGFRKQGKSTERIKISNIVSFARRQLGITILYYIYYIHSKYLYILHAYTGQSFKNF